MKNIVFDMDGVLLDTENVMKVFWQEEADRIGFGDITELYMRCVGTTEAFCEELVAREYPSLGSYASFRERPFGKLKNLAETTGIPKKYYAEELLASLKKDGWRIGLASSTLKEAVLRELTQAGLLKYFDIVIGGDQLERSKPAPDIYLMACRELGCDPSETYAVEDSHNGIRSAAAAGMKAIMVPDLLPATEEMQQLSVAVLKDLKEVWEYLK